MGIKLTDMDKVEAWSGAGILEVGAHFVRIESAEEGETSNKNPQIELEFVSETGDGSIRDWLVVVPKTYGKVKSLLDAVGIKSESGDMELEPAALVGRKLIIQVGEEPDYNDPTKTRKRVQAYSPGKPGDLSNASFENGKPKVEDDKGLPF